ncbi:unnamed protein product [Natator depressus]
MNFYTDSGADITVISEGTYNHLQPLPELKSPDTALTSPGGILTCMGQFTTKTAYKDKSYTLRLYVIKGPQTNSLLSHSVTAMMGLVRKAEELNGILGDIGLSKEDPLQIPFRDNAEEYTVNTPCRIPIPLLHKVETELKRMEWIGIIEKISEPTAWCAPMAPVRKKKGRIRICADLKRLNEALVCNVVVVMSDPGYQRHNVGEVISFIGPINNWLIQ